MKHRFLMTALASIMLLGSVGVGTVQTAQPVQAVSKHSWHWHWVKVTKNRKLYKLRYPLYKRPRYAGELLKGDAEIRYFSYHGYYQVKGLGKGTWIVIGRSTNWFRNEDE